MGFRPQSSDGDTIYSRGLGPVRVAGMIVAALILILGLAAAWHFRAQIAHPHAAFAPLLQAKSENLLGFCLTFFAAYVVITGLGVPVEIVLAVASGALFGLFGGVLLASFASSIGASLTFLASRYLFRAPIERRFSGALARVNQGIAQDGPAYVSTLRFLPIFPFSLANILLGITDINLKTFYVFSQIAMLPALILYVNAGTQLARVENLSDIVSPGMITALLALAAFPWLVKIGRVGWKRLARGGANDV